MRHVINENQETTHAIKNRTTKSRENQSTRRKGNLQILESDTIKQILEADTIKHVEMREKNKNEYLR